MLILIFVLVMLLITQSVIMLQISVGRVELFMVQTYLTILVLVKLHVYIQLQIHHGIQFKLVNLVKLIYRLLKIQLLMITEIQLEMDLM